MALTATLFASACAAPSAGSDLAQLAQAPAGQRISYGADPLQFGELTLPAGKGPFPVVILLHGGCWLAQYDIQHSRALAQALAADGVAVWNVEYRRVGNPGGGWPNTFLDVAAGADFVRTLARTRPLDTARVIVAGHSAGGHLALWLAARRRIPAGSELRQGDPLPVAGVLGLAPAPELDLLHERGACGGAIDALMGGSPRAQPQRYAAAMPSRLAPIGVAPNGVALIGVAPNSIAPNDVTRTGVPQILVIGAQDADWRWVGEAYARRARAAGDTRIEVVVVPAAGHFEVIDPRSAAWPAVLRAARELLHRIRAGN